MSTSPAERAVPDDSPAVPEGSALPEKYRGWRFDRELDLVWFEAMLQLRGEMRAQIDRAHGDGLALEERIEQRFNMLTGADGEV